MLDRDFCLSSLYFPPREKLYQENSKDWPKLLPKVAKLCDTDGIPERIFLKKLQMTKMHEKFQSWQRVSASKRWRGLSGEVYLLLISSEFCVTSNKTCVILLFTCWVILYAFLLSAVLFKINLFAKKIRNTFRVSNSFDPDMTWHFVRPDRGPNCLQRLSAELSHY